jgi:DNA invertase Pin-like site-specific DNA recombinase
MKVGYVRVSTQEQNTARQEVLMEQLGVEKIFIDKASGKNTDRPEFKKMMDFVREGDTLVVESYSRLSRSTKDLLETVEKLKEKGVEFVSKKENIDTSTPTGKLMLTVFAGIYEFERENNAIRRDEGIAIAKAEGKYKGRKAVPVGDLFFAVTRLWVDGDISLSEAQRRLDMAPATFFRKCKQYGIKKQDRSHPSKIESDLA